MRIARVLGVAAVVLSAIGCGTASEPVVPVPTAVPPVPKVSPVPSTRPDPALCRIFVVPVPPPNAIRVGEADLARDEQDPVVLDPDAHEVGCELGATHAVREQAYVNDQGERRVSIGLYRVNPPEGEQTQAPDTLFPHDTSPGPIAPIWPGLPDPNREIPRPPPE